MTLLYTSIMGKFRLMNQAFMGFLLEELKVNGLKYLHKILAIFFSALLKSSFGTLIHLGWYWLLSLSLSLVISLVVGFTSKYFSMYN